MRDEGGKAFFGSDHYGYDSHTRRPPLYLPYRIISLQMRALKSRIQAGGLREGCALERTEREAAYGSAIPMKVSGRTLFYQSPRYPLQVQNNVTYVFTMWIKVPENAQTATFVMLAEPNFVTIGERVTAKAGEWTQLSGEYVHYGAAGESSEIYLRVSSQDSFVTETYYTDDWSVAKSEPSPAGICGESFIRIPDNGEKSVSYEARVTNQIGKRMPNISTQWSLIGRDGSAETPDVSITQNGRLTLSNETLPQQLTIRADSYVDGGVRHAVSECECRR